ncbi:hypothetical protein OZY43_07410 [Lactobacillus sp. ESL0785]|uniref:hypothetical protein n=1 Tax=Lactobacillus sp. ESL0785 TaxID=2983232 RepID=UPI0023F62C0E|nr:hypothetical protein [Lactobacillus sp. ESL0785]WEV70754.1 hypothetical protein OZY43_07410 [Lactobacillus sp. ESL0785]
MPKATNQGWHLPTTPEYRQWSKAKLRERIGHDQKLDNYLVRNQNYYINANTLALYEFQKKPLLGKYKSVLFDAEAGIILSERSSQALITAFCRQNLLTGLEFQRELSVKLHLQAHYVIATGKLAFFSMRSYTTGAVDWVALHQMNEYRSLGKRAIAFESVKLGGIRYTFSFYHCSRYISSQVCNSVYYNHAVWQLGTMHLGSLGWQVRRTQSKSMIDQKQYFEPAPSLNNFSLKQVWQELLDKQHARYGAYLTDYYELASIQEAHCFVYLLSRRPDTLY